MPQYLRVNTKISYTYAEKSFQLRSPQTPWPGALSLEPAGAQPPDPQHIPWTPAIPPNLECLDKTLSFCNSKSE